MRFYPCYIMNVLEKDSKFHRKQYKRVAERTGLFPQSSLCPLNWSLQTGFPSLFTHSCKYVDLDVPCILPRRHGCCIAVPAKARRMRCFECQTPNTTFGTFHSFWPEAIAHCTGTRCPKLHVFLCRHFHVRSLCL